MRLFIKHSKNMPDKQIDVQAQKQRLQDSGNYHRLARSSLRPHLLVLQRPSLEPWLTVSLPSGAQQRSRITELSHLSSLPFFWKDCVIYINIAASQGRIPAPTLTDVTDHQRIFDVVYQIWFPTRDRQHDQVLDRRDFLASLVCFCPATGQDLPSIPQINKFHQLLCDRLRHHDQAAAETSTEGGSLAPTFEKTFIVIDQLDWETKGVLLVNSNALYISNDLPIEVDEEEGAEKSYGESVRMPMLDAMTTIIRLSGNEQRQIPQRGESDFFEEQFGDDRATLDQSNLDEI